MKHQLKQMSIVSNKRKLIKNLELIKIKTCKKFLKEKMSHRGLKILLPYLMIMKIPRLLRLRRDHRKMKCKTIVFKCWLTIRKIKHKKDEVIIIN